MEAHGFELCPDHRVYSTACYFLRIPVKMRLRIYQFLLPDKLIPARHSNPGNLRVDGERVYTAILRVNCQIHDEATSYFYGTRIFTIEPFANSLNMCNLPNTFPLFRFSCLGSVHALQDYQMQLMLLEQQNKVHLLM